MSIQYDPSGKAIRIRMRKPDNWHNHFRQAGDPRFGSTVGYIARQFARANAMGNTTPPILTAAQMVGYRDDIHWAAERAGFPYFEPLMVVMASPDSTPAMLTDAFAAGAYGVKIMPAHGTTNSAHGIFDYTNRRFLDCLRAVRDAGRTALFHAEVPDPTVPKADRERLFIQTLERIRAMIPDLRICVEHVSDEDMVMWVVGQGDLVCATVTPHHMAVTKQDADDDPHLQCMPYPKTMKDVLVVRQAAFTHPRFFYGSDNAPHMRSAKGSQPPASGVFTAPVELPVLVQLFEKECMLEALEAFLSERGARYHGLPLSTDEIDLVRNPWFVPGVIYTGENNGYNDGIVPYKHGQILTWRLAE